MKLKFKTINFLDKKIFQKRITFRKKNWKIVKNLNNL